MIAEIPYSEIIATASEPLMRLFQEEARGIVKRNLCEGSPCSKLCHKARHDVALIVRLCWQEYAKLN